MLDRHRGRGSAESRYRTTARALQAVGVRIRRSRSVALDGILGVAMTLYALLVSDFLDTVASLLQVMVSLASSVKVVTSSKTTAGSGSSFFGFTFG